MTTPVVLVILDGWGIAPPGPGNAVELADTPVFDQLWVDCPHGQLVASGREVGLPEGQMGNSEVGHLAIGAGRVVAQDLVRVSDAAADNFRNVPALVAACERARAGSGTLHIVGLASDGGVHSHVDHLRGLVRLATSIGVPNVAVHAITDGRDVSPEQALGLLTELESEWEGGPARIVDVCGRIHAMDRDQRWERTERAWRLYAEGAGAHSASVQGAIAASYDAGISDEFVEPTVIGDGTGRIEHDDEIIFLNFRPDRARQICMALADDRFDAFDRGQHGPARLTAMTAYWDGQPGAIAFPEDRPDNVLADALEAAGVTQLHVAETEKYAHVTYFFNGGRELEHTGETRSMIPSPRDVATYDLKPEMSAAGVASAAIEGIRDGETRFVIVNFANPDMVGHTGDTPAVICAVAEVDRQLGHVVDAVRAAGGIALITADHGNAEQMLESSGKPHTAHTTNPVPLILVGSDRGLAATGRLADLAPTVLSLLDVSIPAQMTGDSLLR
ncbi:MAG: 2,3-bisphosphoglycerate-independent phosphoglycerate mutase [Actinobacteria bacterium]|nr:2,3-bisphosphoglycerate-independent phosphoglycerate mutase [Actinomycetota bacterium]